MIRFDDSLISAVERYLIAHDVGQNYAGQLRSRIQRFVEWAGHSVRVADLNHDLANQWLADLSASGLSPWTVDTYRRALHAVWLDAYQRGENDNPPLRMKRIRRPRLVVRAYTQDQIRQLLGEAAKLPGRYPPHGNRRSDFWQALIHGAYSTGLRRGDLLNRIPWIDIRPDGSAVVIQSKTGYPVPVRFSDEALAYARRLRSDRGYVYPYPFNPKYFAVEFHKLAVRIGGQFRWLRRSAGSYAERERPGDGHRLLGHRTDRVFSGHYDDRRITGVRPVEPPRLG